MLEICPLQSSTSEPHPSHTLKIMVKKVLHPRKTSHLHLPQKKLTSPLPGMTFGHISSLMTLGGQGRTILMLHTTEILGFLKVKDTMATNLVHTNQSANWANCFTDSEGVPTSSCQREGDVWLGSNMSGRQCFLGSLLTSTSLQWQSKPANVQR